jgi:large subunit ribosomal protein L25
MATAALTATSREGTGKGVARKLRAEGKVPAVVYGHARAPQSIVLDNREVQRLLEKVAAASTVIDLTIDGTAHRTLIREIQRHPLRPGIVHIDFMELVAGETVTVRVHIAFEGTPVGVRSDGGIFEETLHEVEIEADPVNIPDRLVVDISGLHIGHSLHVRDIKLPEGVELLTDPGVTICLCSAPREEVAKPGAEPVEGAPTEPELIRKAKEDEEAEAAGDKS